MAVKKVRFHHADGKINVESIVTFAKANTTSIQGARAILDFWQERGWIVRRPDGGFDVKRRVPRRDPETLGWLRNHGHPAPEMRADAT